MTDIVTPPPIAALPPAPLPTDAPEAFNTKAFATLGAQEAMVAQVNASNAATAQNATAAHERAVVATTKAAEAGDSVTAAGLASGAAATAKTQAEAARDMAQTYAALAGDAAGLPALAGHARQLLQVRADEAGVEWGAPMSDDSAKVGDVRIGTSAPTTGSWLLCDGSVYLQSSYAALFSELGILYNAPGTLTPLVPATMSHLDQWSIVCFGGGIWVALCGNGGTEAASSTDGITWTQRSVSAALHRSAVYGADKFVVVAQGDGAASPTSLARYSSDGITWTNCSLPYSGRWLYVTYGNGIFVTTNNSAAQLATSPDGISWTGRATPAVFAFVGFFNGTFIALTSETTTTGYKSTDGVSWSAFTLPVSASWGSVAYVNGVYVAVAGPTSGIGATSLDGVAWTQRAIPASNLQDLTSGGGTIMSRPTLGKFHTTADGINWFTRTIETGSWARPGFGQGKFVTALVNTNKATYAYSGVSYNRDTQFSVPKSISNDVPSWIKAS